MKFLIDECLSVKLAETANNRGFVAYHVVYRNWSGMKDPEVQQKLLEEELILVTNNRDDFLKLIQKVELHPGLVVIIENARRAQQVAHFNAALDVLEGMTSVINKVVEVSPDETITVYDMP